MKLNQDQQQKILKKLESFFNTPCSCSGKNWLLSDSIFELREFNQGALILGGESSSVFPVIAVTCGSCGNTHFFNAILLGLIEKKDGPKK